MGGHPLKVELRVGCGRQAQPKTSALTRRARNLQLAVKRRGDALGDRQAETHTGPAKPPRTGGAKERLEDVRLIFLSDPRPLVLDGNHRSIPDAADAQADWRA